MKIYVSAHTHKGKISLKFIFSIILSHFVLPLIGAVQEPEKY